MGWLVVLDGTKVSLDDLSPDVFTEAVAGEQASWWEAYQHPAITPNVLHRIIVAAAEHAGVPVPVQPATMIDVTNEFAMLEPVDEDDRPKVGTSTETPSTAEDLTTES